MPKKKPYTKKSFESALDPSDTSSNIYMSMLKSTAWNALTKSQQNLYVYCKAQLYAEKKKPLNNSNYFTMNKGKWCTLYKIYSNGNSAAFYRDVGALISKGFIICVQCGANTRTKNIYAYSDMWKYYGTDRFKVDYNQMTLSMQRKEMKKAI